MATSMWKIKVQELKDTVGSRKGQTTDLYGEGGVDIADAFVNLCLHSKVTRDWWGM
jgi:hypothetical protein